MFFINSLTQDLPGEPAFLVREKLDVNPLSGKVKKRFVHEPNNAMRALQRRVRWHLSQSKYPKPHATAVVRGRGIVAHLLRHRNQRYFYLTDLRGAYASVELSRLAVELCFVHDELAGCEEEVDDFLYAYCKSHVDDGLAFGANASPALFDFYAARRIDEPISALCAHYGLTYTRYFDDLIFSSRERPIGERRRRAILEVIREAKFEIAHHKARVFDIAHGPIYLNGLGMRRYGRQGFTEVFVPPWYLRRIRRASRLAREGGVSLHQLHGLMSVFRAVERTRPSRYLTEDERRTWRMYRDTVRLAKEREPF